MTVLVRDNGRLTARFDVNVTCAGLLQHWSFVMSRALNMLNSGGRRDDVVAVLRKVLQRVAAMKDEQKCSTIPARHHAAVVRGAINFIPHCSRKWR